MTAYVGQPLPRFEDHRFVTGQGRYTDDLETPGAVHAVMVRSPHAHAHVDAVDADAARDADGVLGVYTGADLAAAGLKPIPSFTRTPPYQVLNADGSEMADGSQFPLATDRVRYVGEPVAVVIAETVHQAQSAAELVEVSYRPIDAVTGIGAALAADAPALWPELPDNRSCHWQDGDREAVDRALGKAAHVVDVEMDYPRMVIAFMEPRGVIARFDAGEDRFTLTAGCQSAHRLRDVLAMVFDTPAEQVRVVVPDVGGGFGARGNVYPEYVCALFAARALGCPVRWQASRSEAFLSDSQARSQRIRATLGLDQDGRIAAVRVAATWWHGGYLAPRAIYVLANWMAPMICGTYRVPQHHFTCEGVFTNTAPIGAYRGVARSESIYAVERLMDAAARQIGMDRAEFRRRNMIAADETSTATSTGQVYGPADFGRSLDLALEAIDWGGFGARRSEAEGRGRLRGIAAVPFVLSAGGVPDEYAEVHADGEGGITVHAGTQDFGMGHETAFAQVMADAFGVAPDRVTLVQGDTDKVPTGAGGQGSRCMRIGGGAMTMAAEAVIEQGRRWAEDLLEAGAADIVFDAPHFVVRGTDRSVDLQQVAKHAEEKGQPLRADRMFKTEGPSFPSGCHVCEIEVDPETGRMAIVRFVCVVDPGQVINPLIAEGQVHGGVAQGIGEAALECVVYDRASGQLASGSFMDYAMPRADDLPDIDTLFNATLGGDNPLGVKGIGEAGTVGAPAAVVNAVLDAVAQRGVTAIDMPLTPERVWRALADAS